MSVWLHSVLSRVIQNTSGCLRRGKHHACHIHVAVTDLTQQNRSLSQEGQDESGFEIRTYGLANNDDTRTRASIATVRASVVIDSAHQDT